MFPSDWLRFISVANDLETAGLIWQPTIGDEIATRHDPPQVSILVDPSGMTPPELRHQFLWLPTVEQMVMQLEIRQAVLFHAGLELTEQKMCYKTVVQSQLGSIEASAETLRVSIGISLRSLLLNANDVMH